MMLSDDAIDQLADLLIAVAESADAAGSEG